MKGIIMSGGLGTRLRPLTSFLPKPMVPIFNKPVMENGIALLKKHGIKEIGVTLYYLADKIEDYFGDGSKFDLNIKYYIEEKPLGTGGSVKNAQEFLEGTIVIISGDAFTDIDLNKAYDFHKKKGSKATLILKREPIPLEYGVVVTDKNDRIIRFLEKPSWGEVFSDTVNTGIYILEPEVLDYYEQGENFDFSKDLFPKLLEDDVPMYGYVAKEYWSDVGDLDSYIQTHVDILADETKHHLLGEPQEEGIWIGEGTIIEKGAEIYPPAYIGSNSKIEEGAIIKEFTVIGNNTTIGKNTSIKRSIIWDHVNISKNCEIRKSVICNNVYIGERSRMFEGVVIGSYSKILKGSTIKPNVKVWPYKTVAENTLLTNHLIWGESTSIKLFGDREITGIFNESITPEKASSLGTAFASVIKNKGIYLVSSDEYNSSKLVKQSIISGILAAGCHVIDIKNSTMPMCRYGVKYFETDSGIHIRGDAVYENMVHIEFTNNKGANIGKDISKKIENVLAIENFKRCTSKEVEEVVNIYNFPAIYLKHGKNQLKNITKIKKRKPKLWISSPSQNICNLAKMYLEDIGCQVETVKYRDDLKIEDMQNLVLEKQGDLALLYKENGEAMELTDGVSIIQDEKYYLLALLIGLKSGEMEDVVIPYNYPKIMEKTVEEYKGYTIYSKSNVCNIIKMVLDKKFDLQYILNFDSILATGKIIDYLVGNDMILNKIVEELPEYFYMKKEIPCKWSDKGNIMRRLTENKKEEIVFKEGVKITDDEKGWILIIPDEEKAVFNLYIEGHNKEYLEELWIEYHHKIKEMMKNSWEFLYNEGIDQ